MLYIWLTIAVVLFVLEMFTAGVLAVWFAIGALLAAFVSLYFKDNLILQILVFTISSAVLTFIGFKFIKRTPKQNVSAQPVYSILGKKAVVTKEIDTVKGTGQITINGDLWAAKTKNPDTVIPENTKVKVLEIDGVKAVVEVSND